VNQRALSVLRTAAKSPWVRVGGTLAGMALLAHTVNWSVAMASIGHADPRFMIAALGLTSLAVAASVVEWGVLLRTLPVTSGGHRHSILAWRRLSSSYLQSLFFTQIVPAGVGGDAMRAVEMGHHVGHGRLFASLAGSRMAGMLGMACWGLAGAIILRSWLGNGIMVGAAVMAGVTMMIWGGALTADRFVPSRLLASGSWMVRKAVNGMHSLAEAFASYRSHPHAIAQCLLVGAAGWGVNLLALELAAKAIGIELSWTVFAIAIPLTLLAALAPFSVNGLGVREGVLIGLLTHAGVSSGHAGALSLLIDVQMVPFAILGAVLWMRRRGKVRPIASHLGPVPVGISTP
jgi:glycosyltransferase 2 family protein